MMVLVMKKKGASVTDIMDVPPEHFVFDLMLGTRER